MILIPKSILHNTMNLLEYPREQTCLTVESGNDSFWWEIILCPHPLSEFDDPLVCILPLALLRIPPFFQSALTLTFLSPGLFPTSFFPQSSPLPPDPDPLSTTLPFSSLTPAPAPAHVNSWTNTVLVYLSSEYRTTSVIWSTAEPGKAHDYS